VVYIIITLYFNLYYSTNVQQSYFAGYLLFCEYFLLVRSITDLFNDRNWLLGITSINLLVSLVSTPKTCQNNWEISTAFWLNEECSW